MSTLPHANAHYKTTTTTATHHTSCLPCRTAIQITVKGLVQLSERMRQGQRRPSLQRDMHETKRHAGIRRVDLASRKRSPPIISTSGAACFDKHSLAQAPSQRHTHRRATHTHTRTLSCHCISTVARQQSNLTNHRYKVNRAGCLQNRYGGLVFNEPLDDAQRSAQRRHQAQGSLKVANVQLFLPQARKGEFCFIGCDSNSPPNTATFLAQFSVRGQARVFETTAWTSGARLLFDSSLRRGGLAWAILNTCWFDTSQGRARPKLQQRLCLRARIRLASHCKVGGGGRDPVLSRLLGSPNSLRAGKDDLLAQR